MSSYQFSPFGGSGGSPASPTKLTPEQLLAYQKQLARARLSQVPQPAGPSGIGGFLGQAADVVTPDIVGLALRQIGESLLNTPQGLYGLGKAFVQDSPAGQVWDLAHGDFRDALLPEHLFEIGKGMGQGYYEDVRHPLRNPGYLAMDIAGLLSGGAFAGAKVGLISRELADLTTARGIARAAQAKLRSPGPLLAPEESLPFNPSAATQAPGRGAPAYPFAAPFPQLQALMPGSSAEPQAAAQLERSRTLAETGQNPLAPGPSAAPQAVAQAGRVQTVSSSALGQAAAALNEAQRTFQVSPEGEVTRTMPKERPLLPQPALPEGLPTASRAGFPPGSPIPGVVDQVMRALATRAPINAATNAGRTLLAKLDFLSQRGFTASVEDGAIRLHGPGEPGGDPLVDTVLLAHASEKAYKGAASESLQGHAAAVQQAVKDRLAAERKAWAEANPGKPFPPMNPLVTDATLAELAAAERMTTRPGAAAETAAAGAAQGKPRLPAASSYERGPNAEPYPVADESTGKPVIVSASEAERQGLALVATREHRARQAGYRQASGEGSAENAARSMGQAGAMPMSEESIRAVVAHRNEAVAMANSDPRVETRQITEKTRVERGEFPIVDPVTGEERPRLGYGPEAQVPGSVVYIDGKPSGVVYRPSPDRPGEWQILANDRPAFTDAAEIRKEMISYLKTRSFAKADQLKDSELERSVNYLYEGGLDQFMQDRKLVREITAKDEETAALWAKIDAVEKKVQEHEPGYRSLDMPDVPMFHIGTTPVTVKKAVEVGRRIEADKKAAERAQADKTKDANAAREQSERLERQRLAQEIQAKQEHPNAPLVPEAQQVLRDDAPEEIHADLEAAGIIGTEAPKLDEIQNIQDQIEAEMPSDAAFRKMEQQPGVDLSSDEDLARLAREGEGGAAPLDESLFAPEDIVNENDADWRPSQDALPTAVIDPEIDPFSGEPLRRTPEAEAKRAAEAAAPPESSPVEHQGSFEAGGDIATKMAQATRSREAIEQGRSWLEGEGAVIEPGYGHMWNAVQVAQGIDERYPGGYEQFLHDRGLHKGGPPEGGGGVPVEPTPGPGPGRPSSQASPETIAEVSKAIENAEPVVPQGRRGSGTGVRDLRSDKATLERVLGSTEDAAALSPILSKALRDAGVTSASEPSAFKAVYRDALGMSEEAAAEFYDRVHMAPKPKIVPSREVQGSWRQVVEKILGKEAYTPEQFDAFAERSKGKLQAEFSRQGGARPPEVRKILVEEFGEEHGDAIFKRAYKSTGASELPSVSRVVLRALFKPIPREKMTLARPGWEEITASTYARLRRQNPEAVRTERGPDRTQTRRFRRGVVGTETTPDVKYFRATTRTTQANLPLNPVRRGFNRWLYDYGVNRAPQYSRDLPMAQRLRSRYAERKFEFEFQERSRLADYMDPERKGAIAASVADQAAREGASEKVPKGKGFGAWVDSANQLSTLLTLYLKPGYIAPNLLGQILFSTIDVAWNPIALARSFKFHNDIRKGRYGEELETKLDDAMGVGGYESIRPESGAVEGLSRATGGVARFYGKFMDEPFRRASFYNEAWRAGFRSQHQIEQLLKANPGDALYEDLITVAQNANRNIVDYSRLSTNEKRIIRRVVFFYPWIKGSTMYTARFASEHPFQFAAATGSARVMQEQTESQIGEVPSYLRGIFPVGGKTKVPGLGELPNISNPASLSIFGSAGQALNAARGFVFGDVRAGEQLSEYFTPAVSASIAAATRVDPFTGARYPQGTGPASILGKELLETVAPVRAIERIREAGKLYGGGEQDQGATGKRLFPSTPLQEAMQYFVGGFSPRAYNAAEGQRRAAAEDMGLEARAAQTQIKWDERTRVATQEAKRIGIEMPERVTEAFQLKSDRAAEYDKLAAALGKKEGDLHQIERLQADLELLVRNGRFKETSAKRILSRYAAFDDDTISNFRSKLARQYLGQSVLSNFKLRMLHAGADESLVDIDL